MQTEEALFCEVLQCPTAGEQAAFLDQACDGDVQLRARVQRLLAMHIQEDSLLDQPLALPATFDSQAGIVERPGDQIGPYKLLQEIGSGGFGVVYMAEQVQPVRRRVALKIIKPGMDSREVIARFEAERQALAMMDHPNIAKVLDAGATNSGRPYFVMELVKGVPVTQYCDDNSLPTEERLKLFVQVCNAVQHAHQKGVIHRDLKPSNVMVTLHDGVPVPKVIDFGVSKALSQQLTEKTLFTRYGQMIGTPLYMSPEQAELSGLDVDTRSDVYSLGVLLYELLTGTTPFDKERLKSASFDEMRRIIREEEPETVSSRLAKTLSRRAHAAQSAQHGQPGVDTGAKRAPRFSELDWIAMKALEKDRSRRYESASAFAADVQRYLADEPVLACPPSTMYRFQKFVRKHKSAFATAAALALCLLLGTTVSAWQAVRATSAEAQATANAAQAQASAQKATDKAREATVQRDEIKALYEQLQATQFELKRTLYASHINLAQHAWNANDFDRVQDLLARQRPQGGDADLRGFEWHYLYGVSHAEIQDLKALAGHSVAYSPTGKHIANLSSGKIEVFEVPSGRLLHTFKGGSVAGNWYNAVAFSPDGKWLAGPGEVGTRELKIWDVDTGREHVVIKSASSVIGTVAFSPDGKRAASGGWIRPANMADAQRGLKTEVCVWDVQSGEQVRSIKTTSLTGSIAYSPDGKRLACGSKSFDAQTGEELFDLKQAGDTCVSYSPSGRTLATASGRDVTVWDAVSGQQLSTINSPDGIENVAYSPSGKFLAGACNDRTIRIWNAESGQPVFTIKGVGWASCLAYSPDGKYLVANGDTVKIWDAQSDQSPLTLKVGADMRVESLTFSPDGSRLVGTVVGGRTNPAHVKVWDAKAGTELLHLSAGATGQLGRVAFSPDGKRLVTDAGSVKTWDAQTGKELLNLVVGSSRVDLQACKLEYSIVSPK